uniref:Regulator of microtubule dynamics protein 1 n=1 Tax=Dicentrarchus labrax TaxID=13489 RepID=A0A8C4HJA3_DICLA
MAGVVLRRCVSTLLSTSGAKSIGTRGTRGTRGTSSYYRTALRRTATALTSGRAAFLLGIPTLSCLGYEAYHRVQSSAVVHALEKEEVLEQADYLYSSAESEKLYQLLLQYKDSDDADFLWRLARASRDLSLLPNMEAGRKKQLVFEAFEYAKKALEKDDENFSAHKWYAVCLSDVGDYEGVKVKIGNSYIIREHLERAIKLNPSDATSLHILGYWCFAFAELPWYQRKVAAVIFSSPPTSTYEEVRTPRHMQLFLCLVTYCSTVDCLFSFRLKLHVTCLNFLVWAWRITNILTHVNEVMLLCLLQALEFFLKAEEGKTQHANKVAGAAADLLLAAAQTLRQHCACKCFIQRFKCIQLTHSPVHFYIFSQLIQTSIVKTW